VRKVVLYKHGVGYFERKGEVTGRAAIQVSFKTSEMNDVLKSLTVIDMGDPCGAISSISYEAASAGGGDGLGSPQFEVNVAGRDSLTDLLGVRLKGIRVLCSLKNRDGNIYRLLSN